MRFIHLVILTATLFLWSFNSVYAGDSLSSPYELTVGHANLIKLPAPVTRASVADPRIADITLINSSEIYVLGKAVGTTNFIFWSKGGGAKVIDVSVMNDLEPLKTSIKEIMPEENDIQVLQSSGSLILRGSVANVIVADKAVGLADAYIQNLIRAMKNGSGSSAADNSSANGSQLASNGSSLGAGSQASSSTSRPKVINFLKIRDPQQVMLEVRIAEISKTLLDQLGVGLSGSAGGSKFSIVSNFSSSGGGLLSLLNSRVKITGEKDDGLVKILAEPTIVAMSGQEGSFLAGGKVYIPLPTGLGQAGVQEVNYGVGLKFLPTVLDKGRINLKVVPEVSDIAKELVLQGGNTSSILPNFTIRSVSTTVQIREGETLVIGGLMKNNITETVKAFPVLGELPVLGALFRSKAFASDLTELVVVITPSLVSGNDRMPDLPTDHFTPPSRPAFFLGNGLQEDAPKLMEGK